MKAKLLRNGIAVCGLLVLLGGCGGGNGLGPKALKKQEDKLWDRLPLDWENYNMGNYDAAIEFFTTTLELADRLEGQPGVQNRVKAEAFDGIGWSFFKSQDLNAAWDAFRSATTLDRQNVDAWVGWGGVALAMKRYNDVVQFGNQALETNLEYNSAFRTDNAARALSHDLIDIRHVRLMMAEAYFQRGSYSAAERKDPNNASAQLRLLDGDFKYRDPGQLVQEISKLSLELKDESSGSF
jgi:tetratricopeptide (TPR) repeat protein